MAGARGIPGLGYSAGMGVEETIAVLLGWAVHLSSYSMPENLPRVEYRPESFFIEEVCRSKNCRTLGWYDHKGTVFIDDRLRDRDDRFSRSLLVHEFVHYLQHQSGRYNASDCSDHVKREREAYAIQREYVARAYGEVAFIRMVLPPCHGSGERPADANVNK
ncbi:MAG: hypothetical protein U5P41_06000 [Gammaproteobacteria bacterium]|nr:hypothetical protein [Gammaproteobacteria bacterium]